MCNCANWELKFEVYMGKPFQYRDLNLKFLTNLQVPQKKRR